MLGMIIPGTRVSGSDWNDIGVVKYIIIDPDSSRISGLVVQINTFEEPYKLINPEVVSRLLDQGRFAILNLTREEVELLPDFERNKYIGMAQLSGVPNPILYNLKSKNFILPPTNVYLYPLSESLKVMEAGQVNQFQLKVF